MEVQMYGVICCECGMPFEITADFHGRLLKCHNFFYCPQGHMQHFTGESIEESLRRKLSKAETDSLIREQEFARQLRAAKRGKSKIKKKGK
jgi:hypothetical protein